MNNWIPDPNNPNVLVQPPKPKRHPSILHFLAYPAVFFIGFGLAFAAGATNNSASGPETAAPVAASTSKPVPNQPLRTPHSPPAKPQPKKYGPGMYEVGVDIKPGKYKAVDNDSLCYWARTRSLDDEMSIIANHLGEGDLTVVIKSTDKGFKTSGCNDWTKVS